MFTLIGVPNIDFIGKRKIAFAISTVLALVGLAGFVMILLGQAEMGIDFAGGIKVQGHFEKPVSIDEVRGALSPIFSDIQVSEVKDFSFPNAFLIKTKRPETDAEGNEKLRQLQQALQQNFAGNTFVEDSEDVIGPAVGQQLRNDAVKAILLSIFGIMIYIAIRFDYRSGVAATIAMIHDVLAVVGIFWLARIEFDLLVVSALLTLAGYSLTDKVVVYDRIRENLRKFRSKSEFIPCINRSINETMSRTINTSTTVLVVIVMAFLGGETLRNFAMALMLGVVIGTYSSIFVASPIIVEWEARSPRRFK